MCRIQPKIIRRITLRSNETYGSIEFLENLELYIWLSDTDTHTQKDAGWKIYLKTPIKTNIQKTVNDFSIANEISHSPNTSLHCTVVQHHTMKSVMNIKSICLNFYLNFRILMTLFWPHKIKIPFPNTINTSRACVCVQFMSSTRKPYNPHPICAHI